MTGYQENESILFHNKEETVFLIDIPQSIAEAQSLSPVQSLDQTSVSELEESHTSSKSKPQIRRLISTPPLEHPYSSSTEPKTNAARGRILSRVSPGERRYHDEFIQPLVIAALNELQTAYKPSSPDTRWCLPRAVHNEGTEQPRMESILDAAASTGKKRKSDYLQHGSVTEDSDGNALNSDIPCSSDDPPIILSSSSCNTFPVLTELAGGVVKNSSSEQSILSISTPGNGSDHDGPDPSTYMIPPQSTFLLCTLPLSDTEGMRPPIPGFPHNQQFNLIVFDPPWPNRSVKRSRKYQTHSYNEMELLTSWIQDVLTVHSHNWLFDSQTPSNTITNSSPKAQVPSQQNFAAIWITNSEKARGAAYSALSQNGFSIHEEWIWVKVTAEGEPVYPVNGVWRKPYEILVIGRAIEGTEGATVGPMGSDLMSTDEVLENNIDLLGLDPGTVPRRAIAAVPDLHSRKPNLKSMFERFLFSSSTDSGLSESSRPSYTALEVFARNLTAGWWACGNEVLKFNASDCWTEPGDE
ncbi:hypothetical protein N7493_006691 [Penicillium malachiteum]|uniref:MT-A70-domain-containing protein n=1 Tax=Penicillium malachiteum TaxID=1324776 RepID=A0AAD6HL07_9EURO|nr:hypothetical protein N7493_006691 [Penicillium malachiteum]